jgi:hypothetical protein
VNASGELSAKTIAITEMHGVIFLTNMPVPGHINVGKMVWKDYILFHEYFHGDTGAGIGASHQTGWTGTIARTMHMFAQMSMDDALKFSKAKALKGKTEDGRQK